MNTATVMMARGPVTPHRRLSRCTSALCCAIAIALFCALCCEVSALEVGKFFPGKTRMSAKDRYESVLALQSLQRAIDDPELQKEVESALKDTTRGFDMCRSALYRCNRVTGALEEAVIEGMRGGTVKWDEYPKSVKRIRITDSRLRQPLVLSSLPANLEEFVATNVEWESDSILQAPGSGEGGAVKGPLAHLRVLQCDNCALVKAEVTTTTPQLEWLQVLSLSGNPDLFIDLRELPRNLQSLQLSYTQLAHSTVREVLETAPAFLSLLNISFTGVALTLDMLPSARNQLKALDVSGLESNNPGSPLSLSQLQSACGESGFSLAELYLTRCSLTGTLPDLRNCTKLKVMDVSHNLLDGAVFAQLPENIELLRLNNNAIQGGLRTSELPRTLRSLDLSENHFTGEVDLSALPQQLQYLNIGHNHFSGKVNLTQLPESVKFVYMEYNNFTGAADLVDLPLGIRFIMVHHNNWDYLMPAP
ncbi:hypothetical protein, conserved [Leishmania donovani]|uniref:Leucine Rich Repeat family protein n=1 Tax=Leishmania donovani TaxID=5661 RepID=E9BL21_LEIDO|nr:hypothetical protein, conserved [Leishmania donovani]TPP52847.1 Leucine Rich Repeat family protein [Leishmania donovani]CBZ35949.1 hypothetical protein, conserved [Leishmania donovani]